MILQFLFLFGTLNFTISKILSGPDGSHLKHTILNLASGNTVQWMQGKRVDVLVGFYIESISSVRASDMSFDLDMYVRQSWTDPRLKHEGTEHYTLLDPTLQQKLWIPDIYFANAKKATFQSVTKPNKLFMIYPDGGVHYSTRVIATVSCNLDLRNYPMDAQECGIRIMSYAHPDTELRLGWFPDSPVETNPKIELPEMVITGVNADRCDVRFAYGQTENVELNGNFSCLCAKIMFRRQIGYHLVQTYIPTILIVTISWISFWIDPAAIPARISLSFTTLLTLATMAAGIRSSLPPVAYAKAIDFWVGLCTVFVFGALLEFALVNSIVRKANSLQTKRQAYMNGFHSNVTTPIKQDEAQEKLVMTSFNSKEDDKLNNAAESPDPDIELLLKSKRLRRLGHYIDSISRFIFPGLFFSFNLLYWFMYPPY